MTSYQEGWRNVRLLPGVIILVVQWLIRFLVPVFWFESTPVATFAGPVGWLAHVVWWGFFSRAPRLERWGGVVLMILGLLLTPLVLHESIASAMMGIIFIFYATPILSLALVVWAVAAQRLDDGPRRAALVGSIVIACGVWTLFRFEGMAFGEGAQFEWRWTPTQEEQFLETRTDLVGVFSGGSEATLARWPGFRGPNRDGIVHGTYVATDWSLSPPEEVWRRPVGPGWSSVAVGEELIYTLEQHGEEEVVACYRLDDGRPVWRHADTTRFWESIGGPGPRSTPTLHGGRGVFTFGATGILNSLNAGDGSVVWTRDVGKDTEVEVPSWGFASSPLVVGDLVVIAAGGRAAAYDVGTGERQWLGPLRGEGYSSPHAATIDGVEQVLLMSTLGLSSYSPATGDSLWHHPWEGDSIVQPSLLGNGDILLGTGSQAGRVTVSKDDGNWVVEERWSSNRLKPYFNDFVIHKGYAYGFDGRLLACIDVETGKRQWKGGRYGAGQLVLLADQDLLLVTSEQGEMALVAAQPEGFNELSRMQAVEGKTWNHPVMVDDRAVIRNGQEMAAFRMSVGPG